MFFLLQKIFGKKKIVVQQPEKDALTEQPPAQAEEIENKTEWEKRVEDEIAAGRITESELDLLYEIPVEAQWNYDDYIIKIEAKLLESSRYAQPPRREDKKQKEIDCENFFLKKLNKRIFHLKEQNLLDGEIDANGKIPLKPRFVFSVRRREREIFFGVECKWKSKLVGNGLIYSTKLTFAKNKVYERDMQTVVMQLVGVGGTPSQPDKIYLFPFADMESNFISNSILETYEKEIDEPFRFDWVNNKLR